MNKILLLPFIILAVASSAEDIKDVLKRSEISVLEKLEGADPASQNVKLIEAQFEKAVKAAKFEGVVRLKVVKNSNQLSALAGEFIVVSESFGDFPEAELSFLVSHELGHIVANDFEKMGQLYLSFIPGEVIKEKTDAVAGELGRAAKILKYEMEFAADEFGLKNAQKIGYTNEAILGFFSNHPEFMAIRDTATHPGMMRRRLALFSKLAP